MPTLENRKVESFFFFFFSPSVIKDCPRWSFFRSEESSISAGSVQYTLIQVQLLFNLPEPELQKLQCIVEQQK